MHLARLLALGLLMFPSAPDPAPPVLPGRVYRLDESHSFVEFSVRYLRLMEVRGRFRDWDAAFLSPEEPTRGAVAVVFRAASLDTGNDTRDEHLRSPDFFGAQAHPAIVFVSERIEKDAAAYLAHGTLSMHGTTRPLVVTFRPGYVPLTDARGNLRAGFVGEATLDRRDFGVVGGNAFNPGFDPLVSIIDNEVRIAFAVNALVPPMRSPAVDSVVSAVERDGVRRVAAGFGASLPKGEGDEAVRARNRLAATFNAAGSRLLDDRPEDAVELLRLAVLAAPASARVLAALAEAYARLGRLDAARENVDRALELDPLETKALVLRVWLRA